MKYDPRRIEKKWQHYWKEHDIYQVEIDPDKPKYYVLDMFPYPSGSGLHVGHPLGYIASDIISRYKRLKGFNVLHPMGFDAFGLPAEQYAIDHGIHPDTSTSENIAHFKDQLEHIGLSYDWDREIRTSDPTYYKWTQWIFIQLFQHYFDTELNKAQPIQKLIDFFAEHGSDQAPAFHTEMQEFSADDWLAMSHKAQSDLLMNYRLAYQKVGYVNWCEALGTVLANDEVKDGFSARGGHPVIRKPMLQWSLRITAYAERLLQSLDELDWSPALKSMQTNWIGKSTGARIEFRIDQSNQSFHIFTTRPDTIYGVTFMVLAPEHPILPHIVSAEHRDALIQYQEIIGARSERERMADTKTVSGVFTGAYAIHPLTSKKIPIWVADYVLMDYGTGAIMAVPADDSRDRAFAEHFGLDIIEIIKREDEHLDQIGDKHGILQHSDILNGLTVPDAIDRMNAYLKDHQLGEIEIRYKLRDANFSRQRYWGEPFPVVFDQDGVAEVLAVEELPLELPQTDDFKPSTDGLSPLARLTSWSVLENGYTRESDTMPGFAGSSWYFLRYMDPHNDSALASSEALDYWRDVDLYIGGTEHAVGHLLYARFCHKFLFDLGMLPTDEPFRKLVNQGMIQGRSSFIYRANEKMAEHAFYQKLKENGLNPEREYPIGGIMADFALPDDRIVIEIKSAMRLNHFLEQTRSDIESEGWKVIGVTTEEVYYYWYDFDQMIKRINQAKAGHVTEPDLTLEPVPVFFSLDRITDESLVTSLYVHIDYVDNDRLDINRFMQEVSGMANAIFVTNSEGEYICGHAIEKMSKSKYNVVNPDDVIDQYGADAFRMYEMFLGPIEQSKPWDTNGIDGVSKFLNRFWGLFHDENGEWRVSNEEPSEEALRILYKTLNKVEDDLARFSFNTCISQFMITVNELKKLDVHQRSILRPLTIALSPFAPHIAEELWHKMGEQGSIIQNTYPVILDEYLKEDQIEYPISINGKKRATYAIEASCSMEEIEQIVIQIPDIQKYIADQLIKKIIIVPGRMINIVV